MNTENRDTSNTQFKAISSGWSDPLPEEDWGPFSWAGSEQEMIEACNNEYAQSRDLFTNPLVYDSIDFQPKYLNDVLGRPMLSPGQIHIFYGPSESKKTFLGLAAVLENHGFYIDLEMGGPGLSARLRKMNYEYSCSDGFAIYPTKSDLLVLVAELCERPESVVVIDSFSQLSVLMDKDTNSGGDTGSIFQEVLRPLATAGHAVVVIDHSPKARNSNDHPIGSQNKKAQADVMLRMQVNESTGHSEIYVEKDRYHVLRSRLGNSSNLYGEVRLTDNPLRVKIIPQEGVDAILATLGVPHSVFQKMVQIMQAVISTGGLTKSEIDATVTGKSQTITAARNALLDQGFLVEACETVDGHKPRTVIKSSDKKWLHAHL